MRFVSLTGHSCSFAKGKPVKFVLAAVILSEEIKLNGNSNLQVILKCLNDFICVHIVKHWFYLLAKEKYKEFLDKISFRKINKTSNVQLQY